MNAANTDFNKVLFMEVSSCKNDIECNFIAEKDIGIEVKKYNTRKNKKGFCNISVAAVCQPKDITKLNQSNYSLDDENKLPVSLIYKS